MASPIRPMMDLLFSALLDMLYGCHINGMMVSLPAPQLAKDTVRYHLSLSRENIPVIQSITLRNKQGVSIFHQEMNFPVEDTMVDIDLCFALKSQT